MKTHHDHSNAYKENVSLRVAPLTVSEVQSVMITKGSMVVYRHTCIPYVQVVLELRVLHLVGNK